MALIIPLIDIAPTQLTALLTKLIYPNDPRIKILTEAPIRYRQQVFTLGLSDIIAQNGIQAAQPGGVYLLAAKGAHQAVEAQLSGTTHDVVSVSDLSDAARVRQAIDAIQSVQRTEPAQDPRTTYELVTLEIPGLLFEAYWLKPVTGGAAGWLYPFHTFFTTPPPLTVQPADEYLRDRAILELAQERAEFPDRGTARKA